MKIINIEKINGRIVNWDKKQMYPVKITYKKRFQKKIMCAFPIERGPTFGSGEVQYIYYVDSLGKTLNESESINNYIIINQKPL